MGWCVGGGGAGACGMGGGGFGFINQMNLLMDAMMKLKHVGCR